MLLLKVDLADTVLAIRTCCRYRKTSQDVEVSTLVTRIGANQIDTYTDLYLMFFCAQISLWLSHTGLIFSGLTIHITIGSFYILNTPNPLSSPSQDVECEPLCPLSLPRLRAARANPKPMTSRVSVGLIIPSSHSRAVEYNAVD